MIKVILVLSFLIPSSGFAANAALDYQSLTCSLSFHGKIEKTIRQQMMTLLIDDDSGRFAQIQFGDEKKKIQYQLLIEKDPANNRSLLVLQNLLIDHLESSSEFSATALKNVRLAQGKYSVSCALALAPVERKEKN